MEGLVRKAQTVLGAIDAANLGVTLPHEHLWCDAKCTFIEPSEANEKALAYKPVSLENLSWLRYQPGKNIDNVSLLNEQVAINEAMLFKQTGGNTIVDVTPCNIDRNPKALASISRATGLNVIMGSGYYTAPSHSSEISSKSEEDIAEEIVRDITVGVGDSGIRAGIIGEIGGSWPLQDSERKVMRAATRAQRLTGAPVTIHPGFSPKSPFEIVEVLANAGADLNRVIISHLDVRIRDHRELCRLAETGCYIEYDAFAQEGQAALFPTSDVFDAPNDVQRIYEIRQMIDEGYLNQILISHDICQKTQLVCYGGWGYAHISNYMVPMMLSRGITKEQINAIMVENPKRLLCFV